MFYHRRFLRSINDSLAVCLDGHKSMKVQGVTAFKTPPALYYHYVCVRLEPSLTFASGTCMVTCNSAGRPQRVVLYRCISRMQHCMCICMIYDNTCGKMMMLKVLLTKILQKHDHTEGRNRSVGVDMFFCVLYRFKFPRWKEAAAKVCTSCSQDLSVVRRGAEVKFRLHTMT